MNNIHQARILLLEGIHPNAVLNLKQAGFSRVESLPMALEGDKLQQALCEADVIGIRSRTQLTAEILKGAPHLKAVGCFCIGTNQVDSQVAEELGIPVFNAPHSNTRSVAELVLAEIIMLMRSLGEKNQKVHQGAWPKDAKNAYEVRGKTLGIIGYGNIGSQLSVLAEGLGMRVIYHDIISKLPLGNAEQVASLDDLLKRCDVVSLHVPELPSTKNLIAARELYLMKQGAYLINAARGHCVHIEDLAEALRSGHLGGAALDVFPIEPKSNQEALESPLRGLPNVILTPHIGGSTVEAQANIGVEVADKLIKYLKNGDSVGAINFPEIALPKQENTHRILHLHHNRPGILSAVNRIFGEYDINITAQSLMTRGAVGYLIMDIAHSDSNIESALASLHAIEGTIRMRSLY